MVKNVSSYHSSFSYLDKNSKNDFGWIIAAFDPDNGEMDSYLSQEQILSLTNKACSYLIGEHDFSSFKASGGLAKTSVRTIFSAEVKVCGENMYYLEICGDGFLYNMVRIIAGTLVGVATERFKPEDVANMIVAKDRKKAGVTAPPHGLYLYNVEY